MKLIKNIYDEPELTKLIDYLEMLRKEGVLFKNYEGVKDLSDILDESFMYEGVEYILNENICEILKPKYNVIRIVTDYRLGEFDLTRVYLRNWRIKDESIRKKN